MNLMDFIASNTGKSIQAPGGIGGQCVDLANLYMQNVLGLPIQRLNAVDWQNVKIPVLGWIANGANNYPPSGAIVVWNPYAPHGIGQFGHIAVCVLADNHHLVTFDQNWPDGSPCAFVLHDYGGVAGWLYY